MTEKKSLEELVQSGEWRVSKSFPAGSLTSRYILEIGERGLGKNYFLKMFAHTQACEGMASREILKNELAVQLYLQRNGEKTLYRGYGEFEDVQGIIFEDVMSYREGQTLHTFLHVSDDFSVIDSRNDLSTSEKVKLKQFKFGVKNRSLNVEEIVSITSDLGKELQKYHSCSHDQKEGVIHFDVTLDNILFCNDYTGGSLRRVVLLNDFGIARARNEDIRKLFNGVGTTVKGGIGSYYGTLNGPMNLVFSPPDAMMYEKAEPSFDTYQLTNILSLMLTGKMMEYWRKEAEITLGNDLQNILIERVKRVGSISGIGAIVTDDLAKSLTSILIKGTLGKDERYQSAKAMVAALGKLKVQYTGIPVLRDVPPLQIPDFVQSYVPKKPPLQEVFGEKYDRGVAALQKLRGVENREYSFLTEGLGLILQKEIDDVAERRVEEVLRKDTLWKKVKKWGGVATAVIGLSFAAYSVFFPGKHLSNVPVDKSSIGRGINDVKKSNVISLGEGVTSSIMDVGIYNKDDRLVSIKPPVVLGSSDGLKISSAKKDFLPENKSNQNVSYGVRRKKSELMVYSEHPLRYMVGDDVEIIACVRNGNDFPKDVNCTIPIPSELTDLGFKSFDAQGMILAKSREHNSLCGILDKAGELRAQNGLLIKGSFPQKISCDLEKRLKQSYTLGATCHYGKGNELVQQVDFTFLGYNNTNCERERLENEKHKPLLQFFADRKLLSSGDECVKCGLNAYSEADDKVTCEMNGESLGFELKYTGEVETKQVTKQVYSLDRAIEGDKTEYPLTILCSSGSQSVLYGYTFLIKMKKEIEQEQKRLASCTKIFTSSDYLSRCIKSEKDYHLIDACGTSLINEGYRWNCISNGYPLNVISLCKDNLTEDFSRVSCMWRLETKTKSLDLSPACFKIMQTDKSKMDCLQSNLDPKLLLGCYGVFSDEVYTTRCAKSISNLDVLSVCKENLHDSYNIIQCVEAGKSSAVIKQWSTSLYSVLKNPKVTLVPGDFHKLFLKCVQSSVSSSDVEQRCSILNANYTIKQCLLEQCSK